MLDAGAQAASRLYSELCILLCQCPLPSVPTNPPPRSPPPFPPPQSSPAGPHGHGRACGCVGAVAGGHARAGRRAPRQGAARDRDRAPSRARSPPLSTSPAASGKALWYDYRQLFRGAVGGRRGAVARSAAAQPGRPEHIMAGGGWRSVAGLLLPLMHLRTLSRNALCSLSLVPWKARKKQNERGAGRGGWVGGGRGRRGNRRREGGREGVVDRSCWEEETSIDEAKNASSGTGQTVEHGQLNVPRRFHNHF